jgi:hypothetical protein
VSTPEEQWRSLAHDWRHRDTGSCIQVRSSCHGAISPPESHAICARPAAEQHARKRYRGAHKLAYRDHAIIIILSRAYV